MTFRIRVVRGVDEFATIATASEHVADTAR
jgi:hypothetical protein